MWNKISVIKNIIRNKHFLALLVEVEFMALLQIAKISDFIINNLLYLVEI